MAARLSPLLFLLLVVNGKSALGQGRELLQRVAKARAEFEMVLAGKKDAIDKMRSAREGDYLTELKKLETDKDPLVQRATKAERQRFEKAKTVTDSDLVREPRKVRSLQSTYRNFLKRGSIEHVLLNSRSQIYRAHLIAAQREAVKTQDPQMMEAIIKEIAFLKKVIPSVKPPPGFEAAMVSAKYWRIPNWPSPGKPPAAAPTQSIRTWRDSTGQYEIKAALLTLRDGVVRLKKQDGSIVSVPVTKLSRADQAHLQVSRPKKPLSPFVTPKNKKSENVEYDIKLFTFADLKLNNQGLGSTIRDIAARPDGTTWFATNRGLVRVAEGKSEIVDPFQVKAKHEVRFLHMTKEGTLWAMYPQHGLAKLEQGKWETFAMPDDLKTDRVNDMTRTPDGSIWIAAWHGSSGTIIRFLNGKWRHARRVGDRDWIVLKVHADETGAIWTSAGGGGLRRYWDGKYEPVPNTPNPSPTGMAQAPSGEVLVGFEATFGKGGLAVFDGKKSKLLTKMNSDLVSDDIAGLDFAPDGALWIVCHREAVIRVHEGHWQVFGKEKFQLRPNTAIGIHRVTATDDGTVWIWDRTLYRLRPKNYKELIAKAPKSASGISKSSSPASTTNTPTKSTTPSTTKTPAKRPKPLVVKRWPKIEAQGKDLSTVATSADGRLLAIGSNHTFTRNVQLWDLQSGNKRTLKAKHAEANYLRACEFSPSGRHLAVASGRRVLTVFDTTTGEIVYEVDQQADLNDVSYSHDGTLIACATGDNSTNRGKVIVRDAASGEAKFELAIEGKARRVQAVAFSPRQLNLAVGSDDGRIRLWDIQQRKILNTCEHGRGIQDLAFSPDGIFYASAAHDYRVKVWDTAGKQRGELRGSGQPLSVAVSSDGLVVAGCTNGYVNVWTTQGYQPLKKYEDLRADIAGVAFSPDGKRVIAVGGDTSKSVLKAWDLGDKAGDLR